MTRRASSRGSFKDALNFVDLLLSGKSGSSRISDARSEALLTIVVGHAEAGTWDRDDDRVIHEGDVHIDGGLIDAAWGRRGRELRTFRGREHGKRPWHVRYHPFV